MKAVNQLGLALAVAGALAAPTTFADNKGGKVARSFDVCVNAATDAVLTNFPPNPGDRVTAVGMMLPAGTIPSDGSGDATCVAYQNLKVGTFFVNGTFVSPFGGPPLPQAAGNDLAYVQWHFRVTGVGSFETSGPITQFAQNGTYPQVLTGGTGRFKNVKGNMTTEMLGAGGFQIRVFLPHHD
jgi:hypothetical protein